MKPSSTSASGLLAVYPHLTGRDRHIIDLLARHQVLTTGQLHRIGFRALRTCQIRLTELRALGVLERFRFGRFEGGSYPWHWTLGLAGARLHAAATGDNPPTVRAHTDQLLRLTASPHLTHLVSANEFFVRLTHTARRDPRARLTRWWSERESTRRFPPVRPDGHGIWHVAGRAVGFFVEADQGTETLARLVDKLDAYARLTQTTGISYPVLFWLTSTRREEHLQTMLRRLRLRVPVATATQNTDPAESIWLPTDGHRRVRLCDLHSEHGFDSAANPNFSHGVLDLTGPIGSTGPDGS
ncbi:replication-relaxation family protein [Catellatospora chokoriensis]|uniref:Protein involved in plasmid replication-relaxation n=1 Tax=Catellatospora chokoriensis TaxID=310353 RepID=A0A8J3K319_9ACTN|nr:replication-relaxation family protein [Catellatospora chokoriensis]GIF89805.1 hypothetical protein Cch02nite_32490 [Catellatospora chokoriensis]